MIKFDGLVAMFERSIYHQSIKRCFAIKSNTLTPSLFDLSGQACDCDRLITGCSLALARGFAEHGASAILNGREIGPIDILVNNAGMQFRTALEDFPADRWEQLLKTNGSSVFYAGQAVARHIIARSEGKIINIASVQSERARPGIAPYTATKGAVKILTRGMCADWAKYGLQINAIAPGYFKTPLNQALVDSQEFSSWLENRTPAARWGNVDELIGAAVFLSSKASSLVNGHTLYVDGGITTYL